MPAFPAIKLAAILVKQMAKPLSNFAKEKAKSNHFFRNHVCIPPAQLYHWCEIKMKMSLLNLGKANNIPKLNEQTAIELGANLLGEGVIFVIAVGVLTFEYSRQKSNEYKKEMKEQQFINELGAKLDDLTFTNEELDTKIRELTRLVYFLESKVLQSSCSEKKSTIKPTENNQAGRIQTAVKEAQSKITNR